MRLALAVIVSALVLCAPARAQERPLGVVDQTLARFDRDTLQPTAPTIPIPEAHAMPIMGPGGTRLVLGVSSPGEPGVPTTGQGRVGLLVVDPAAMRVERQIRAGIAAESVVFPGMIAAVLQDGALIVVDPDDGRIVSRREVGFSFGTPGGAHVAGRGVLVNQVRRGRGVEVVVVSAGGHIRTTFVRLPGVGRTVALAVSDDRAYIVGNRRIAVLDPKTLAVRTHRFDGSVTTAAYADGALAIGGASGLRIYDTTTWRLRARDDHSSNVFASGRTLIASGRGHVTARDPAGSELWRADGNAAAVAAGRVYARPAVLDVATGERVGTHPESHFQLRLIDP